MKRKQLLALVLVIGMMIGVMPVAMAVDWSNTYCDACGSKGISYLGTYSSTPIDMYECYSWGIDEYYCETCGYVMRSEEISWTGEHTFYIRPDQKECWRCEYKNPFFKEESEHVGVSAKIDTEYSNTGNATTHKRRDVYGFTCTICSETVIERYTEWTLENHKDSGQGWCLLCGAAISASNDEAYPIITNLSVSPNAAGMSTPISVSGLVDGNGGTIARVRVSVFYNDSLTSGKVYKDYEVNSATFDLSTVGTIVPGATLAQDGTLLIPDKGSYSLAVFATNTNGKGQGDSPALCGFTVGSCTHPNYGYDLNGKGRTVKLDDEKHLYIFPVIYSCTICGEKWNGTESTEGEHSLTVMTKHDVMNSTFHFVKKCVVCTAGCGMEEVVGVNTEKHNASEKKSVKVTQFPQSNDRHVTEHVVTEVTSLTCADCEYEISTKSNEDWQNHSYTNDKCACGYTNGDCTHATFTDKYDNGALKPIFSNIIETHHDVQNGYMRYCEDCKQYTGETGYFDAVPEEHDFTNGDVCVCGYDRTSCAHTAVEGSAVYVRTYFEAENASTHKAVADDYEYTCSKCHKTFVEKAPRSEDSVEKGIPHAWDDSGKCQSNGCGYGCAHTDITKAWVDGKSKTIKLTDNKDGATHTHTYSALATCNTCQSVLGMMEEIIPNEPHRVKNGRTYYNQVEGGHQKVTSRVCSCGYSEQPIYGDCFAHNETKVTNKSYSKYPNNNDLHISYHEVTFQQTITCSECEYVQHSDKVTAFEQHSRGNVCSICGYEKVQSITDEFIENFGPDSKDTYGVVRLVANENNPFVSLREETDFGDLIWMNIQYGLSDISGALIGKMSEAIVEHGSDAFDTSHSQDLADDLSQDYIVDLFKERMQTHIATMLGQDNVQKGLDDLVDKFEFEHDVFNGTVDDLIKELSGKELPASDILDIVNTTIELGEYASQTYEDNIKLLEEYKKVINLESDSEEKEALLKAVNQLMLQYKSKIGTITNATTKLIIEKGTEVGIALIPIAGPIFEIADTAGSILFSSKEHDRTYNVAADAYIEGCLIGGTDSGMIEVELAIRNNEYVTAEEYNRYLDCIEYVYVSRISQMNEYGGYEKQIKEMKEGLTAVLKERGLSDTDIKEYLERVD